ncbi:hypothetical protein PMAYCL1PPCAC_18357 [Pristionchus mayeri]|uniref:Uncharacterized protein n=1 Tax=Pristionchus mayeri TaxID=1317129 RepID=A0AAN5I180_9BILA|nr:hypothetical protein PMAYCL1PPCAC_18357 [Pristionchus mayeri]
MQRSARRLVNTMISAKSAVLPNQNGRTLLFPETALVETKNFELLRFVSSTISQTAYSAFLEKSFTKESMLIGANDGLALSCSYMVNRNWDRLSSVASNELVHSLQSVRDELDDSFLSALSFSTDDVVHSFIYRSFFSGNRIFNVSKSGNLFIYYIIVSYIRKTQDVPYGRSPSEYLGRHRSNLSVANIGYCRAVNPLGPWKIAYLNFST